MPKNKIQDLRDHLFETIELLKNNEIDVERAKAICDIGQTIVNSAKLDVEVLKHFGDFGHRPEFIPVEKAAQKAEPDEPAEGRIQLVK